MEDYRKKYEDALERAKEELGSGCFNKGSIEYIFPELKESAGEKIRKALIDYFEGWQTRAIDENAAYYKDIAIKDILAWLEKQGTPAKSKYIEKQGEKPITIKVDDIDAITDFPTEFEKQVSCFAASIINKEYNYDYNLVKWAAKGLLEYAKRELEKQGEQNPIAEIKPRFKVGDWIIHDKKGSAFLIAYIDEENQRYIFEIGGYSKEQMNYEDIEFADTHYHLWSIMDAKDGDVLASSKSIFIFKKIYMANKPEAYYAIMNDSFKSFIKCPNACWTNEQCHPATKEQRKLLFRKIEEKGFKWNATTKELNRKEDTKKSDKAWSEEDEELLNSVYVTLEGIAPLSYKKELDWLKTIKGRIS